MDKRKSGKEFIYTIEWKTRDGGKIAAVVSPRILYDAQGNPAGSFAVITDVTELKRAEEELRALLQEKTVMLKEIHHRVKNNLQLISSLFSLQYQNISDSDTRNMLYDSQSRIQTMSRIHEFLYQSNNFRDIEMKDFLEQLVFDIETVYLADGKRTITFCIDADTVELSVDRAVPCGLIMNELVSNAVKHAFPLMEAGLEEKRIVLFFKQYGDTIHFGVEDNGKGLPAKARNNGERTLGLELVTVLTEQLRGTITFGSGENGSGSRVEVCIPHQRDSRSTLYAVQ